MGRYCIILPSYNPTRSLVTVTRKLLELGADDIIVVNDGSRQDCHPYFDEVKELGGVTLLEHKVNKGKGAALKTAFAYCLKNRKDALGVVTADDDGQHTPEDIILCGDAMEQSPDRVILGARNFKGKEVPPKSKVGNKLTSLIFLLFFGMRITDTQTGLRAIPMRHLKLLCGIKGDRFEYESNALLEMKKHRIKFREVTIHTIYLDRNSGTHFHALFDSMRIYAVILKFFLSSLLSAASDILIFTLFNLLLNIFGLPTSASLLISTVTARVLSSIVNFTFNRMAVFHSVGSLKRTIFKYYLLCAGIMLTSYAGVYFISEIVSANTLSQTGIKVLVDAVLFFISFSIQEKWVFNKT